MLNKEIHFWILNSSQLLTVHMVAQPNVEPNAQPNVKAVIGLGRENTTFCINAIHGSEQKLFCKWHEWINWGGGMKNGGKKDT